MSNNKKIIMCVMLLVITINVIVLVSPLKINKEKEDTSNMLSILIEDTKGSYVENNNIDFKEGYNLNKIKSYCEKNSKLLWDKNTKKLKVKATESDKCYLYFDKERTGTEDDPYEIQTIEDLVDLSNEVNAGDSKAGKYYVLVRDLDFSDPKSYEDSSRTDYGDINGINSAESLLTELTTGRGFLRIGTPSRAFEANFNGQYKGINHRIDNLYVNFGSWPAFFGAVKNSTISNLTVNGNVTSTSKTPMGGLINYLENSTIENTISEINVTQNFNSYLAGGLVGYVYGNENSESKIINCINKGNISGGGQTAGLVGNHQVGKLTIEKSINEGTIRNNYGTVIGGIVGSFYDQLGKDIKPSIVIKNSSNKGKIISNVGTEQTLYIGGLIGYMNSVDSAIIDNSYNIGNVKKESTIDYNNYQIIVGGLIGLISNSNSIKISNSYNIGMLENGNRIGGLLGYNDRCKELIIDNSYNGGNIKTNITGKRYDLLIGGIIGYNVGDNTTENNKTIILNSYNLGNINANQTNGDSGNLGRIFSSGILGIANYGGNIKIINSYNIGNILGITENANVASGITYIYGSNPSIFYLNNVYNLGEMQATNNYEIGFIATNTTKTINNSYYNNGKTNCNQSDSGFIGMIEANMKNESFVSTLNNNISNIKLRDIDASLTDYTLNRWKLGLDGYPMLEYK